MTLTNHLWCIYLNGEERRKGHIKRAILYLSISKPFTIPSPKPFFTILNQYQNPEIEHKTEEDYMEQQQQSPSIEKYHTYGRRRDIIGRTNDVPIPTLAPLT